MGLPYEVFFFLYDFGLIIGMQNRKIKMKNSGCGCPSQGSGGIKKQGEYEEQDWEKGEKKFITMENLPRCGTHGRYRRNTRTLPTESISMSFVSVPHDRSKAFSEADSRLSSTSEKSHPTCICQDRDLSLDRFEL